MTKESVFGSPFKMQNNGIPDNDGENKKRMKKI